MSQFRYERKFLIENLFKEEVGLIIKKNPYLFKKKYQQRFVNNIYFDSLDYSLYNNHVIGKSDRYKIRVRWYDDLFGEIKKPILEIKSKNNYLGKKEYCNLDKFHLDQTTQLNDLVKIFNYSNFPEKIKILNVRPVLINRYLRDYFESSDRKFRVTLDTNLFYYSASFKERLFTKVYNDKNIIIVELKYAPNADLNANKLTNYFPFRKTKSSKYIRGIQMTRRVIF